MKKKKSRLKENKSNVTLGVSFFVSVDKICVCRNIHIFGTVCVNVVKEREREREYEAFKSFIGKLSPLFLVSSLFLLPCANQFYYLFKKKNKMLHTHTHFIA